MAWDRMVAVDSKSGLCKYIRMGDLVDLKTFEFEGDIKFLRFVGWPAYAIFVNVNDPDRTYPMFLNDFAEEVKNVQNGILSGKWTVRKRGVALGLIRRGP